MIFGKSHRYAVVLALSALLVVPLVGCGGGSGDGSATATPTPDPASRAVLVGRVVDSYNGDQAIAGVVVRFNGAQATTATDGTFRLEAPSTTGTLFATVTGPNNGYYSSAYVNGTSTNVVNPGIEIGATAGGVQRDLGTIKLFSTDGPPPPPPL